jgi:hypothetical protein
LRRYVAAIKNRSYKAAAIAEKITQMHKAFARPGKITFERFYREEILGHWSCPSGDYRQGWITAKREARHTARYGDREHLLDSSPKRVYVHRSVQLE